MFQDTCWCYSFMLGVNVISIPPNGAALMKAQVLGHVDFVLVKIKSLFDYAEQSPELQAIAQKKDELIQAVGQRKEADIQKAMDPASSTVQWTLHGSLKATEALFVPCGWLLVEMVPKDQTAVYGARKSFFIDSVASRSGYQALRDIYNNSGRDVSRMDAILALFKSESVA